MRLYSTTESVKRGEVSVLAIAETLAAVTLVFYLSAHFNTLKWLAFAMCLAPLLLLRTEESTRLSIKWYDGIYDSPSEVVFGLDKLDRWQQAHKIDVRLWQVFYRLAHVLHVIAIVPLGLVAPPIIRSAATFIGLMKTPSGAVQAIPKNWARVTLATDSAIAPELIPDHPSDLFRLWMEPPSEESWVKNAPAAAVMFLLLFLPSLLYRWSLKATSIIYAPLVFVLHSTFRHVADLRTKLELIKRSDLTRISTVYALIFITAFLLKLVCMMNLPGFADWWNAHPMSQFAALYVAPAEIPMWQLASLTNCVLALAVMGGVRQALLRIELGTPWPEGVLRHALGFTTGVRWLLSLYTILCTGYVTMNAARGWHWPTLGTKWLPWL